MDDISPLFALEAEQLMLDGKTDEAIELCNAGLLDYPDYPAAYAVLAQAYLEFEDYEAAKDSIKMA
jgi:predicted Zn-dependent protease